MTTMYASFDDIIVLLKFPECRRKYPAWSWWDRSRRKNCSWPFRSFLSRCKGLWSILATQRGWAKWPYAWITRKSRGRGQSISNCWYLQAGPAPSMLEKWYVCAIFLLDAIRSWHFVLFSSTVAGGLIVLLQFFILQRLPGVWHFLHLHQIGLSDVHLLTGVKSVPAEEVLVLQKFVIWGVACEGGSGNMHVSYNYYSKMNSLIPNL